MKHGVTHVAWVLSAASVAGGAQMATDILALCPALLGDADGDDV